MNWFELFAEDLKACGGDLDAMAELGWWWLDISEFQEADAVLSQEMLNFYRA